MDKVYIETSIVSLRNRRVTLARAVMQKRVPLALPVFLDRKLTPSLPSDESNTRLVSLR